MVGFRGRGDVVVGAIAPLELVVAGASTACGALVLDNPGRLASEQGWQLTQKTPGQFTKMGMAAAAVDTGDLHQGSTRGDFEGHRIGRSFEAGDQGPDMTEGGLRGVERADAPSEAGAFIGPQEISAYPEGDGTFACHEGARSKQGDRFVERHPPSGIGEHGEGAILGRQR